MGGQVGEQIELAAGQRQLPAGQVRRARGGVDVQVADVQRRRPGRAGVGGCRAAQHGAQPGGELTAGERLDQVVVGAGVEQPDDLGVVVPGGGDQHRDAGYPADHAQHVEAVQVGQAEVEHHDVRRALGDLAQRLEALVCGLHRVAVSTEDLELSGTDSGVVLDYQYGGHEPER